MRTLGEKENAALETRGKFRHLPVIEDGRLIGIVSIGDVVESRLEELEQESDTLREYIHRRAHHKYD